MNSILIRRTASITCFIFIGLGGACTDTGEPEDGPAEGYVRFRTEPIDVGPGESGMWTQWVAAPMDQPMDIVDIRGYQSAGGHHALLMATADLQEPGFTRAWEDADQLSTNTYGGVGGPGGERVVLPEGVMWRIPAGKALAIQTHYLNTSDQPILGESYLDVKMVPASDDHLIASQFAVTSLDIQLEPGQSSLETDCVLPQDVGLVMWTNHMHELGARVVTDVTVGDRVEVVKDDPIWSYEWAFNPNFSTRTADDPRVLPAGSTVRIECSWVNEEGRTILFPDEMCVFFGYYLGTEDLSCVEGKIN